MKTKETRLLKMKYFTLGFVFLLLLVATLGATSPPINIGRFQISAWATGFGGETGGCGAFIVDTTTGNTKTAYTVIYGDPGKTHIVVNNLRKPFGTIK